MKTKQFQSTLGDSMADFVKYKRMQGYDYHTENIRLGYFDCFLCKKNYTTLWLDQTIVNAYREEISLLAPNTRINILSLVRGFTLYLHFFFPQSYVLQDISVKRPAQPCYYIYSLKDMNGLFAYTKTLDTSKDSLRPRTFYVLLGLLYTTGLRINEALSLTIEDVNTITKTIFVRKGKFSKDRYVVFRNSTSKVIEEYLSKRMLIKPRGITDPFFMTSSGKRITRNSAVHVLRCAIKICGITAKPWFHNFRHTYASQCLAKWYKEGKDVNAMLPILATSLGHVNIQGTQIYLHVSEYMREEASKRFYQFVKNNRKEL